MRTKENWLTDAVHELENEFKSENLIMPAKWRISSGFPSKGGLAAKKRTIGQCFDPRASKDGTTEIIISITQDEELKILGIIAHEMIHATGIMDHGPKFKKIANAIGLEGKMTATEEGELFITRTISILKTLGDFPHAALDHTIGRKKQTTRMIKVECSDDSCGMVFRTSNKWVVEADNNFDCPICAAPAYSK
jgi:hypothetical protein|tara:strand:- start:1071 stop:1649 length:579 start_codon:yes stop_codon:yes gene_type:complete